ncbi:polysaccharide biosynthesis protein [Clostridium sp. LY3-2]|uniref:putative polysaccharide biosynthesis protein n=1 Tax=Clostridium sp. LY3-2 TaxID=2942482 RepID=UPI002152A0C6|nr:polysaccharide biosynthesis protein [Clostridium sp. LY3-2]MCR6516016.1 polysaccharide biosynthesis protein [Clostridium sp. LY3-2]
MREESSSTKGFMILSLAGILAKLLSALYVPLLNQIIGAEGVGIYARSYDIFIFVYAIASMGCQPAVAKIVSEIRAVGNEEDAIKALKVSRRVYAIIGGGLTVLLMILAFPIAHLADISSSAYAIFALAPSIVLTAVLSSYRGYFQGRNEMTSIAVSQVLEQILNVVISLLFAFILVQISLPLGSAGGNVGTSVGALIACFYLIHIYDKKEYEEQILKMPKPEKRVSVDTILRKLVKYGLPITLSAGIQNFGGLVDMVNVNGRLLHAGFTSVEADTLYGLLYNYKVLLSVPLIIVTALGTTILPRVSKAAYLRDRKEIKSSLNFALRLTLSITIPAAVGLAVLSDDVYKLLYGGIEGSNLMVYGSFIVIFMAVSQIQGVVLQGISQFYPMLISFTIGIVLKIIANFIFVGIPNINIMGVLIGNFLCYAVPTVINAIIIKRHAKIHVPLIGNIVKPLIASAFMALAIIGLKNPINVILTFTGTNRMIVFIYTMVLIGVGGLVYFIIMVMLGGIRKRDIDSVSTKVYKLLPRFIRKKLK